MGDDYLGLTMAFVMHTDEERVPVRRLQREDERAAATVLARAFRDDPLVRYYFDNRVPNTARLSRVFVFALRYALLEGEVYAPAGELRAVAAWLPPGRVDLKSWTSLRAGAAGLGMTLDPQMVGRTERYGQFARSIHHKHMPGPHWYLYVLGVAPRHQGNGLASDLIRPMVRRFDATGTPCYLETHNPRNIAIYERFGFRVLEAACFPGTDVTHWAMGRVPTS